MTRVAVVVGTRSPVPTPGTWRLPSSDRSALSLAMSRFGDSINVYGDDGKARCYARAAGANLVFALPDTEIDGFDIALIGLGGCGERGDLMPALIAERRGAALVYDVIDVDEDVDGFRVTRDLGQGARDILRVRDPMVLVIANTAVRGPYISQYRLDIASRESTGGTDREESPPTHWNATIPRVRLGDHESLVAGSATDRMNALFGVAESSGSNASILQGSGEECSRHLLDYLRRYGFVDRGLCVELEGSPDTSLRSPPTPEMSDRNIVDTGEMPTRIRRRPRRASADQSGERGPLRINVDLDPGNPRDQK